MADPVRFVRLAAARVTIDIPTTGLTAEERLIVEHARADLWATVRALADYPEMQMRIGGFALMLRNLRAADAAFREAARMDPQLIDAWMSRARIALAERRIEYAAAILQQGLEQNSDSVLLRQSRGTVLVQLGALEAALQELNDAARLAPNEPSILLDIATIHTLRGENQKALAILNKARGMGANGPGLLELLAVTNRRLGRMADARALALELANRFPQYRIRPELAELLEGSE
jgi:tetratricopeptide (TPR) repeat protein